MDDLRLILLLVGVVVLALMILVHRKKHRSSRSQADWRVRAQEPSLSRQATVEDEDAQEAYRDQPIQPGLKGLAPARDQQAQVITLYIRPKDGRLIQGQELSDAAKRAGLTFGEMNIYHRRHEGTEQAIFSMANLVAPGDFNPDDWSVFETPGVSLFAQLPGPVSALDCWDSMLATATRLTELLNAEILDSNRVLLSRKRIGEMRDQMRALDRAIELSDEPTHGE